MAFFQTTNVVRHVIINESIDSSQQNQQGLQRANWLIVHSGISRISIDSLSNAGMCADGCHSTLSDDVIITYIHMKTRCRQTSISKFMVNQFGQSAVKMIRELSDKSLTDGVQTEFQLLIRHIQERRGSFVSDGENLGILSKLAKPAAGCVLLSSIKANDAPPPPPKNMQLENDKLRQRILIMEQDHVEMERRLRVALDDCTTVKAEMGSLRRKILSLSKTDDDERMERESELKRLRIENFEFRRLGATEKEVRRLNRELMTLQDNFDSKSNDCKAMEIMLRIAGEDFARLDKAAAMAPRPSNYRNDVREQKQ